MKIVYAAWSINKTEYDTKGNKQIYISLDKRYIYFNEKGSSTNSLSV